MKKTLTMLCLVLLCSAALVAQNGIRTVRTPEKSEMRVPGPMPELNMQGICSNLGTKTDIYNDTAGFTVSGPNSSGGKTQWDAFQIKCYKSGTLYEIDAAVLYSSGGNQVNLSLYSDNNGAVGTLLVGPITVTGLGKAGTCCTLARATLSSTFSITAGTKYWIEADTPTSGTGSDFSGIWYFLPTTPLNSSNTGTGWSSFNGYEQQPAARLLGTIP